MRVCELLALMIVIASHQCYANSWDPYIANLLAQSKDKSGTQQCVKAAIIGLDGGAPWTTLNMKTGIALTTTEAQTIAKTLKSGDLTPFMANGINAAGKKYQFLRADENAAYGKLKNNGAITLQTSKTAVVIALTGEGLKQGGCNKGVSVIAEYLESLGM